MRKVTIALACLFLVLQTGAAATKSHHNPTKKTTSKKKTILPPAASAPFQLHEGTPIDHAADEDRNGPDDIYPDNDENPGATNPDITQDNIADTICNKAFRTGSIRPPASFTTKLKIDQMANIYGDTVHQTAAALGGSNFDEEKCKLHSDRTHCYEEDHIISLENGGAPSDKRNLWPEPFITGVDGDRVGAHEKDKVENFVHNGICLDVTNAKFAMGPKPKKSLTLAQGQRILAVDWYACYQKLADGKDCIPPK